MGSSEREHENALMEGHLIAAADEYFKARHEMLDTLDRRRVYEAAYKRAWDDARRAQTSAEPAWWLKVWLDGSAKPEFWSAEEAKDSLPGWRQRPELIALHPLFAAPQQAPLTPEQVREVVKEAGFDRPNASYAQQASFISGLRHGEAAHGISAGKETR